MPHIELPPSAVSLAPNDTLDYAAEPVNPAASPGTPRFKSNRDENSTGFKKGMTIKVTGVDDLEGKEAIITAVGSRGTQLYIAVDASYMTRIWAENASLVDDYTPPKKMVRQLL